MATPDRLGTSQLHVPPGFIDIETDDIGTPQRIAYRVAEDVVDARSPGQALCRKLTFPCADAGEAKSLFVEACADLSGRWRNKHGLLRLSSAIQRHFEILPTAVLTNSIFPPMTAIK